MDVAALLKEAFGRLDAHVEEVCDGLDEAMLTDVHLGDAVGPGTNTIGWLLWHQARQHDAQMAAAFGTEQIWTNGDWPARFHTDPSPQNHGYGHTPEQVDEVRPDSVEVVIAYQRAVNARSLELLDTLSPSDLDRVVDTNWTPPVTMGQRLVSVVDDAAQHCGQAKFLRGILERRT